MKRLIAAIGLLLFLLPQSISATDDPAASISPGATTCVQDIDKTLNRERFLYESVLFGVRPASEERGGATRVDSEGTEWIKNDKGKWVSDGRDAMTDDEMDRKTASDPLRDIAAEREQGITSGATEETPAIRHGILESQQALTSDLLPPILQSFRAFQCRAAAACEGIGRVAASGEASTETMQITIPGCETLPVKPVQSCRPSPLINDWNDLSVIRAHCDPVMRTMVRYQEAQLAFLTHEDAAHRTLRQFAGYLEPMLQRLRFPFVSPLRQVADFLNRWSHVPCFLPYCAE